MVKGNCHILGDLRLRLFFVFGFFLLVLARAQAFTVISEQESRFVNPEVAIDITRSGDCSPLGMTVNQVFDLVMEAVDKYWNKIPHCGLNLIRGDMVDVRIAGDDRLEGVDINSDPNQLLAVIDEVANNRILVGCNEGSFDSPGVLAAGTIANNRGLVFVNASSESLFRSSSRTQQLAVLAHEIGHAFGLGHSADPVSLMYYSISGKVQEKLSNDDFDGCAYLYPNDFPGNCSMVPYLGKGGGDPPSSGRIFWMGLFFGLAVMMALSEGVSRLWRN